MRGSTIRYHMVDYCCEKETLDSRNHDNQADTCDAIEVFNSNFRYLGDLLNIDDPYFEGMSITFIHLNYC